MHTKLLSIAIGSAAGMAVGRMLVFPAWQSRQTNIGMAVAPSTKNYFTIGGALVGGLVGVLVASRLKKDVAISDRKRRSSLADKSRPLVRRRPRRSDEEQEMTEENPDE